MVGTTTKCSFMRRAVGLWEVKKSRVCFLLGPQLSIHLGDERCRFMGGQKSSVCFLLRPQMCVHFGDRWCLFMGDECQFMGGQTCRICT